MNETKKHHLPCLALAAGAMLLVFSAPLDAQSKGVIVEQIVARVNNQIITLSDFEKADQQLHQETAQNCQNCSQDRIEAMYMAHQKDLLRDLIDQQLLIERGKDMDLSVETDVIKQLDDVRKQNGLATMEDLQKAVEGQGLSWEDYKTQIRNSLLTREVIRREVGSRIRVGTDDIKQYYDAHKDDFNRPEQVALAEISFSTDGKSPEEAASVQQKAKDIHKRIVGGEDFGEMAKRYSDGPTAKDGGELGTFERGQTPKEIEDAVFPLNKGGVTDVIQTRTGFEIYKVLDHFQAGLQPLDKVEDEISNKLYEQQLEPALRTYLAELREESYVTVKPGYTDSAAVSGGAAIQEVAPTPDTASKKHKKKLPLPKASG